ncbi:unnamed protein product [Echinostoma caproni]|uniref:PNP_UDP_1 domain-containing protein n=1 Tax=Echinostoma caproni TaxID=27848 RepID=A0A182ZZL2_9TREM|nr:unnamed protein product [Echinostoma caproni]
MILLIAKCSNDISEQARLDGAFCCISEEDKFAYLRRAYEQGVRNFEMECTCFTALCRLAGVRGKSLWCTLLLGMRSVRQILWNDTRVIMCVCLMYRNATFER